MTDTFLCFERDRDGGGPALDAEASRESKKVPGRHRISGGEANRALLALPLLDPRGGDGMTGHWIGTWAASPMNVWPGDAVLYGFHNQTVRQVVRISKGGTRFCVRLSNEHGSDPIDIGAASIARAADGGSIEGGSLRRLTFGGSRAARILPGAPLLSDPVELAAGDLCDVAVSLYFSGFAPIQTYHYEAQQTAYISDYGEFVHAERMPLQQTSTSRYFLTAVLVECEADSRSIVCFGDSITDGFGSTVDANARWPDRLAERLSAAGLLGRLGVLNHGIGGNRVTASRARGASALARFDRDVLGLPNVGQMVLLEGINDIGWPGTMLAGPAEAVSLEDLVGSYRQLIARAHMRRIKVIQGTLTPCAGAFAGEALRTFHSPEKERVRRSVNDWIRASSPADAVIDFDRALADPKDSSRIRPEFDCGDGLHPSDAGYKAMADLFDLDLFGPPTTQAIEALP
ncbi:SGNH/GDSL hydrolase family protein [Mesorhizobium sp. B3-1-9]|nr:SGNH/GDSL hydrolase family protein [Mesorhizobium sp. B3-1-9]